MKRILFLPSTPLNVLVSSAVALQQPSTTWMNICLIDQRNVKGNPYYQALKHWSESPFKQVNILPGKANGLDKLVERGQNFAFLEAELDQFQPDAIAVGSDRRIEFQYAMHYLARKHRSVKGVYLDDGLYSYAGRKSHLIKDGVGALLKKIFYGVWWQEPKTIGTSDWIDQAWLFQPSLSVHLLQKKNPVKIDVNWFKSDAMLALSERLAEVLGVNLNKAKCIDFLLLIPHPNNIKKIPNYESKIKELIVSQVSLGKKVSVKYHPRTDSEDPLNLKALGIYDILPSQMAFEFCLPLFPSHCVVLGDVGTALLTTKWLRPDIAVKAVLDEKEEFQNRYIELTKAMQIEVLSTYVFDNKDLKEVV